MSGLDAVKSFLVAEWLGSADDTDYDGKNTLEGAMQDMQDEWEVEGDAHKWGIEFEIGGVSVQKVWQSAESPLLERLRASQGKTLAAIDIANRLRHALSNALQHAPKETWPKWLEVRDKCDAGLSELREGHCPATDCLLLLERLRVAEADAVRDVLAERRRQISAEGYTFEHDDEHINDEIAALACFYVMPPGARDWPAEETGYGATFGEAIVPHGWTAREGDRHRDLVKAGALILAEIERLNRAAEAERVSS